jgi:hypothetical protein
MDNVKQKVERKEAEVLRREVEWCKSCCR